MLFDPSRCAEVRSRCAGSWSLHLFHQLNRSSGIPHNAGPPEGSFPDRMFRDYDIGVRFDYRLRHAEVKTWIGNFLAYLHYEARYQQVKARVEELEAANRVLALGA